MSIPLALQRSLQIKPMGVHDGVMLVAPLYPLSAPELSRLSQAEAGLPVQQQPLDRQEILRYLRSISGGQWASGTERDYGADFSTELLETVEAQASDLHIRLMRNGEACYYRRRVHGYLQAPVPLDAFTAKRFVTWVKQRAELDSSEQVQPQEGRFSLNAGGVTLEFRVSCAGQSDGETMVIRVLDPRNRRSLDDLCGDTELLACMQGLVSIRSKQGGLILVSGPTGAGKTTTLAALTAALPLDRLKVVAIEDPVEIRTDGVDHLEVDAVHGLGFATLLRAVLRQDPDVIVVGEIRDTETAEIALRAVETGHLVMASVHAGSVLESVLRLSSLLPACYQELGRMTIQNRLQAVINQRLQPHDGGRALLIEALFVQAHAEPLDWYAAHARPAEFPGCRYFARPS